MEEQKEQLLDFFRRSPHEALQRAEVQEDGNVLNIRMDIDDRHHACCELSVHFLHGNVIRVVLEELRISRSVGCRRGNDYLEAINYTLEHYFTSLQGQRVYFEVQYDISSMKALSDVEITTSMKMVTTLISKGEAMEYLNGTTRDFYGLKLADLIRMRLVRDPLQDTDLVDFWNYVMRQDYPKIYDGSIRVSELASIALRELLSVDFTDPEPVEGTYYCPWIVHQLLKKYWYGDVLPSLMFGARIEIPRGRPLPPKVIKYEIIDLGLVTLLSREDFKTWYMARLNLSLCDKSGQGLPNASELQEAVVRLQSEPFVQVVPRVFRKYFHTILSTKHTVLQCMQNFRARKHLTFYEAMQMFFINWQQNKHFEEIMPYFINVCRTLSVRSETNYGRSLVDSSQT